MLYTNLRHIQSADEHARILSENTNVMIVCGRMGSMCVPVYGLAEALEKDYPHIRFFDMEFDHPEAYVIRNLPEVSEFMGIPFTLYYNNGKVVRATSGLQTKAQIMSILDNEFAPIVPV